MASFTSIMEIAPKKTDKLNKSLSVFVFINLPKIISSLQTSDQIP
jgi:hypothetical protein